MEKQSIEELKTQYMNLIQKRRNCAFGEIKKLDEQLRQLETIMKKKEIITK